MKGNYGTRNRNLKFVSPTEGKKRKTQKGGIFRTKIMPNFNQDHQVNTDSRYTALSITVYIIGVILLIQLFNLQIIKGSEYAETSNTKLTRESVLNATRGSILDRTGNVLASTKISYNIELYKTKLDTQTLNDSILNIINVLQKNGDSYIDNLPINVNQGTLEINGEKINNGASFEFNISDEKLVNWKKSNKFKDSVTAEQCYYYFKEKYEVNNDNEEDARKIIAIRYRMASEGYTTTKSIVIASNISNNSVLEFNERNAEFPGLNVIVKTQRDYPQGSLASHIIGYVGRVSDDDVANNPDEHYQTDDFVGKSGIEYTFENYLRGRNGVKQIDMSIDGTVTNEYVSKEAVGGSDVVLSIDSNLQKVTEQSLANVIQGIKSGAYGDAYDSNAGSVVVMNVKTGEILAMASYPDFQPQDFVGGISTENWEKYGKASANNPLLNRAIQSRYAPGSTYKMVTATAALETGAVGINETVNDTGVYPRAHHPVCWIWTMHKTGHGPIAVSDALKKSCNFFFYEMGYRVGIDTLEQFGKYFGLDRKTGVELPNEKSGILASKQVASDNGQEWGVGDTLSAAIGQSYNSFTPIQMARYISILVNGGENVNPSILKGVRNSDGSEVSQEELKTFLKDRLGVDVDSGNGNFTINHDNLKAIFEGMRSVTSETGGTAYSIFKDFNIEVGGKTGSAQAGDLTHGWFVGFAPFDDPEIAIVVMIENGGNGSYTAHVARDVIAQYFGMNSNQVTEDSSAVPMVETQR